MKPRFSKPAVALIIALLSVNGSSSAQESGGGDLWTRDKLTGDWLGLRSELAKRGFDIGLRLSQYQQWVTSGGVDENDEYGATMDYRVNVDGDKLFGAKGFSISMHARTRFGNDINADVGGIILPNTGMLMPAPGNYHGTDVTGLTVSQFFPFFGGLANLTLGKLDVVDTVNGFFPNLASGQEGFWNINSTVSVLPWFGAVRGLSLYGGLGMTINQEYKSPESGIVVLATKNESTSWGSLSNAFEDGYWLAGFHRFFWKLDDKPGYFMVFVAGSTADQASNDPHDFIAKPGVGIENTDRKTPWDVALYFNQDLWQAQGNPNRKATLLIGGTVGPDNPQFAQYNFFANVEAFGLIKSRPHDRMGVSGFWNGLSPEYKKLVSPLQNLRNPWGFEAYYNYEVNKWLHLSADLQLVKNEHDGDGSIVKRGRESDDLAVIPGLRMVVDF